MEKKKLNRHDLLFLTKAGKHRVKEVIFPDYQGAIADMVEEMLVGPYDIPGIVRRGKAAKGQISIGFVHYLRLDDLRIRIPEIVEEAEIRKTLTPYEVAEIKIVPRNQCMENVESICRLAKDMGVKVGVLGSAALEKVTGLPYTDIYSDIDLLVAPALEATLNEFYQKCKERFPENRIDMELGCPNGYGVKIVELWQNTNTILGKSLFDVAILKKSEVRAFLK